MERKITVRFNSETDMTKFNTRTGLNITALTKTWNLLTGEHKDKKVVKKTKKESKNIGRYQLWLDMPRFVQPNYKPFSTVTFITDDKEIDLKMLSKIFDQNITKKTKSVWYPKVDTSLKRFSRLIGGSNGKYPIYIVSKGRYKSNMCLTATFLNRMGVPHFIVVEPQEVVLYQKMVDDDKMKYSTIIEMDMDFKKIYDTRELPGESDGRTGPGAARNFCWSDSIKRGFTHHWVMDDNIRGFRYLTNNTRWKCRTGAIFKATEEFGERFKNCAIISLNYKFFVPEIDKQPPFITNTRMYSIMLIRNDIPYCWTCKYNEDTAISLDIIGEKDKEYWCEKQYPWCTIQMNAFLADKVGTQTIKGGNTAEFYSVDGGIRGTEEKTDQLVRLYPEYARKVIRFNREHHFVDYTVFTQPLVYQDGLSNESFSASENDYGMHIVKIPEDWAYTEKDTREYIETHLDECTPVDFRNKCYIGYKNN